MGNLLRIRRARSSCTPRNWPGVLLGFWVISIFIPIWEPGSGRCEILFLLSANLFEHSQFLHNFVSCLMVLSPSPRLFILVSNWFQFLLTLFDLTSSRLFCNSCMLSAVPAMYPSQLNIFLPASTPCLLGLKESCPYPLWEVWGGANVQTFSTCIKYFMPLYFALSKNEFMTLFC